MFLNVEFDCTYSLTIMLEKLVAFVPRFNTIVVISLRTPHFDTNPKVSMLLNVHCCLLFLSHGQTVAKNGQKDI